jgi:hypothetical protein
VKFFVPGVPAEETGQQYAVLAEQCGVPVPPPGERIQSITFHHHQVDWVATVGELLQGSDTEPDRHGRMKDFPATASDPATVRAIFAGDPYMVMTDARPERPSRRGRTHLPLDGTASATSPTSILPERADPYRSVTAFEMSL